MIKIPDQDKRLVQVPQSDVLGNIHGSYNLDLTSNRGRIRVGNATRPATTSTQVTFGSTSSNEQVNMGLPSGFAYFSPTARAGWYAACSGRVFKGSTNAGGSFVQDSVTGTPTDLNEDSDIIEFNSKLYVTSDNLYSLASTGNWSFQGLSGRGGSATIYANRLYFKNLSSKVVSLDTSDVLSTSGAYTIQLGDSTANNITTIRASSNRIWIATLNRKFKQATVYEWDGVTENVSNRAINVNASGILAMAIKDDVPWVLDNEGVLREFNGSRFVERARLPIDPNYYFNNMASSDTGGVRFVHPNGMTVHNGRIQILINGELADSSYSEIIPSGVWEYDESVGLYHKHSISYNNSFGQFKVNRVGALMSSKKEVDSGGNLLIGADVAGDIKGVWYNDAFETESKSGYLITPKLESQRIQDTWQKVWCKYKESAEIVVKYRVEDEQSDIFDITWTDGDTFTSTDDLSNYEVGDEVEVLSGQGGISHITAISASGGTYTVEVDETVTGLTGSAEARLSKWIKLGKMTDKMYHELSIGKPATWLQLKIVMYFDGSNEIEEIIIERETHQ